MTYHIHTLVDITDSGFTDPRLSESTQYNQAQNLNVILQTISMRAQPMDYSVSRISMVNYKSLGFGKAHTGSGSVWHMIFHTDTEMPWLHDGDPVFHLKSELHGMVFVDGLTNTVKFQNNVFSTHGGNCNIVVSTR